MVEASASLVWLSVVINDAHVAMDDTSVSNKRMHISVVVGTLET
jgi:hypothetical protein